MRLSEKDKGSVTLSIVATGEVGSGKSRALESIVKALHDSPHLIVIGHEKHEGHRCEIALVNVAVQEPWKSED